jgi:hypothetical protein
MEMGKSRKVTTVSGKIKMTREMDSEKEAGEALLTNFS